MQIVNLTFYQMFYTSINSLHPCVKADISVDIFWQSKSKQTYQTNFKYDQKA